MSTSRPSPVVDLREGSATSVEPASDAVTYLILDGVRRAKAAALIGRTGVECVVWDRDGRQLAELTVEMEDLWSRRTELDISDARKRDRFDRVLNALRGGKSLPPIIVTPTTVDEVRSGVRLADVQFDSTGAV